MPAKVQIENIDFVIMSNLIERISIAYVNYESCLSPHKYTLSVTQK